MLRSAILVSFLFFALIFISCHTEQSSYVPKPKGFNRIELPPHRYQQLVELHPYQFEYSKWAKVLPDTFATAGKDWLFVNYPQYKANIQLTYKPLDKNSKLLQEYINDTYKLAGKHQVRASSIQEQRLMTQSGRTAVIFKIEGDVPSPYQFYTTDSVDHFLRGAIYLSTASENDSLAPVIDYIKKDMLQLLNTLKWR